jgi:CheY-like chemotaxis protein
VARILVAATERVLPQVSAALVGHEVLETTTLQQAQRLILEDGIELCIIGIHFDDSRAVELVKFIRLDPSHRNTPIIITRLTPSDMSNFIRQTMDGMKKLLTISDYLELEGDPLATIKIKDSVTRVLLERKLEPKKSYLEN